MKRYHFLLIAGVIGSALYSCSVKEEALTPDSVPHTEKVLREVIVTASLDDETPTRTNYLLDPTDGKMHVFWTPGDSIKIFSAGEEAKFVAQNTEPKRIAKFKGTVSFITGADDGSETDFVWGLYPYRRDAYYVEPDGISRTALICTELPNLQVGKAGTFADDLAITIGRSESLSIPFKNAYSGIYVTLNRSDITTVLFRGNDGEELAGWYSIGMHEVNGTLTPYVDFQSGGQKTITLKAPGDQGATFEAGKEYYIITFPDIHFATGFNISLITADGKIGTFTVSREAGVDFACNKISSCKNVDSRITEWTAYSPIVIPDNALRNYVIENFDLDGDGQIYPAEAEEIKTLIVSSLGITSMQGIEQMPNLEGIAADWNTGLTSLDLSHNPKLTYLSVSHTGLTSLDLSCLPLLGTADCSFASLTELDVTKNPLLKSLNCNNNLLTTLDLTGIAQNASGVKLYPMKDASGNNLLESITVKPGQTIPRIYPDRTGDNSVIPAETEILVDEPLPLTEAFKQMLIGQGYDTNGDGEISKAEAEAITYLRAYSETPSDLVYLKNVEHIWINPATLPSITSLDFSVFPKLYFLELIGGSSANLKSVTGLGPAMKYVNVNWMPSLTSIDLTNCPALESLAFCGNGATSLDISFNTRLRYLHVEPFDDVYTVIYHSDGQPTTQGTDWIFNDHVTFVNVNDEIPISDANFKAYLTDSQNPFDTDGNGKISRAEAEAITVIGYTPTSNQITVQGITFHGNRTYFTSLKGIEYMTGLTYLHIVASRIVQLDLSKNTALQTIVFSNAPLLTSMDLSQNVSLTSLELAYAPNLPGLDLSHNEALTKIHIYGTDTQKMKLDQNNLILGNMPALQQLGINNCKFTDVSFVSRYGTLAILRVYGNALTSLNISALGNLSNLGCYNNQLTSLDVSANTKLSELYCSNNLLSSLDVSSNLSLTTLSCHSNRLTSLDVSNNTRISSLLCYGNQIPQLDVSACASTLTVDCNPMNNADGENVLTKLIYRSTQTKADTWDVPEGTIRQVL